MNKKLLLCIFSVYFFSLNAMEQEQLEIIKLGVEGKIYEITPIQAAQSVTLANLLREHTNPDEPIPLPENITRDLFDYIYKDLVGIPYDPAELSDELLGKLFDAAYYLDAPDLMDNYLALTLKGIEPEIIEQEITFPDLTSRVIIEVDKKLYVLTKEQAKKSKTLAHILEDLDVITEPIPLPENITKDLFDYIYKDLTDVPYSIEEIDKKTLLKLINTANYLDIPDLLTKYSDEFVKRVTKDLTSENLYKRIVMVRKLSPEISYMLTQKIIAFSSVVSLIKKICQPTLYANFRGSVVREDIKFSHDRTKITLSKTHDEEIILDLLTNKYLGKGKRWVDIVYSSDNKMVGVILESQKIALYEIKDNKQLWNISFKELVGRKYLPYTVINFSFDDSIIIFQAYHNLIGINVKDGTIAWKQKFEDYVSFISIPGAPMLIVKTSNMAGPVKGAHDKDIYIVNVLNGAILKKIELEEDEEVKFSSDNKKIIITSKEMIKLYDLEHDKNFTWAFPRPLLEIPAIVTSSNNKFLAVYAKNSFISVGDMSNGKTLWVKSIDDTNKFGWGISEFVPESIYFSPDSTNILLMSSKNIYLFDVLTGSFLWNYVHVNDIKAKVFFSPDSSIIFVQHNATIISMLNRSTGKSIWEKRIIRSILNSCFLLDGSIIAVIFFLNSRYKILFYNAKTGENVSDIEFEPKDFSEPITSQVMQLVHDLFSFSVRYNQAYPEIWLWSVGSLQFSQYVKNISCDQALLLYYTAQVVEAKAPLLLSQDVYNMVYISLPEVIKKYSEKYNKALGIESVMVSISESTKSRLATVQGVGISRKRKAATEEIIKRYEKK